MSRHQEQTGSRAPSGGATRDEDLTGHLPVLASIWAQDQRGVLGTGTGMLWNVPADFAHFRRETRGCPVIMGRASWEALGGALPERTNIVITTRHDYVAEGAHVVTSLEESVDLGMRVAEETGAPTVWITGGARVYSDAMDMVQELVVTYLDLDAVAARGRSGRVVHAPQIDPLVWRPDPELTDADWRPVSGDARWRVTTWIRR